MPRLVYVCSPLRAAFGRTMADHQAAALRYCQEVWEAGDIPIAVHSFWPQFVDDTDPHERQSAMLRGRLIIPRFDDLIAFGGHLSEGMCGEIQAAETAGVPIYWCPDGTMTSRQGPFHAASDLARAMEECVA